ncbi:hypothetical protein [Alteriqipengyuania sp.]|uniref:hypothetical protein n=1 Tax=Alteriqipengyuania sp. TaxID=2800692 RepID=UPI003514279A
MEKNALAIGTLSFAKLGSHMELSPERRIEIILGCIQLYRPKLLITAGYAVHSILELSDLTRGLADLGHGLAVVAEVHHETTVCEGEPSRHALWMIGPRGRSLHRFGSQAFGRAAEASSADSDGTKQLRLQLQHRTAKFENFRLFGLICGEINIVQGRHLPRYVCPEAKAAMFKADIVVNPTHDRMGNGGTLKAKRAMMSLPSQGRDRLYVSCSNWDPSGIEHMAQRPSRTLHTVYRSGQPLSFVELADGSEGFVYRRWECCL